MVLTVRVFIEIRSFYPSLHCPLLPWRFEDPQQRKGCGAWGAGAELGARRHRPGPFVRVWWHNWVAVSAGAGAVEHGGVPGADAHVPQAPLPLSFAQDWPCWQNWGSHCHGPERVGLRTMYDGHNQNIEGEHWLRRTRLEKNARQRPLWRPHALPLWAPRVPVSPLWVPHVSAALQQPNKNALYGD